MTFKKKLFIAIIIIGLFVVVWFWQRQQPPQLEYLTETVTLTDIEETVIAGGQVYAEELVDVGAQATGRVDKLHVKLGQRLKKGDLIADIDATQQQNTLKDEQASYQALIAQHDIKKLQLAQSQNDFNKQKQGFDAGIVSEVDLNKAKNALSVAQKELSASTSQLEQAKLKIATAKTNLAYTRITAPIDGVVVSVVTKEGQTINAMQSSPTIIKLAQIDTVQIKAKFSEADIPKLKVGMTANFTILGLPNQKFNATLEAIELSPIGDSSQSGAVYYYGLLSVPNPNHELFIGMTANVTVMIAKKAQTLAIPLTALGKQVGTDEFDVQVIDNQDSDTPTISTRKVKVGINDKINTEIVSGLKQGEKVIVSQSDGKIATLDVGL
ncbi:MULTISPECIES: efflux RND transporter periplasmic adaptor subunit [unclassified Moraxella]|uniref:efflux RND transporter periplasmic adaptor subunit n=1 Tax=unclassified Moraxella TaxID=2685852 RepID=UPI002B4163DC|nr:MULTISPECIES: efflux RND transporter periplasmic adaptor subunit [unclassified Moraxella]